MTIDEKTLQQVQKMWQQPTIFFLTPMPDYINREKFYGDAQYVVLERMILRYTLCMLNPETGQFVVNKMLEANMTILDPFPQPDPLEVLWHKRKNEFVLVEYKSAFKRHPSIDMGNLRIQHKVSQMVFHNPFEYPPQYKELCKKMIEAGVEIWSEEQWRKFIGSGD